jgi:hypothetical protein
MLLLFKLIFVVIYSSGESEDEIRSVQFLQLDFGTIKVATDDFSDANKLSQGGFGVVYKVT